MIGAQGIAQRFVAPLTQRLGDLWCEGKITAVHEHFANGHIRAFVSNLAQPFAGAEAGPALVVATPSGQLHEMGALLVGAMAANLGWQVICLGAGLPALEPKLLQCGPRCARLSTTARRRSFLPGLWYTP